MKDDEERDRVQKFVDGLPGPRPEDYPTREEIEMGFKPRKGDSDEDITMKGQLGKFDPPRTTSFAALLARNDFEIAARMEVHKLLDDAMFLLCNSLGSSRGEAWTRRVEAWTQRYESEFDATRATASEVLATDPRCPHCKRPVILGYSKAVKGAEGSYHERCVEPPDEAETRVGPIKSRESNVARKEE